MAMWATARACCLDVAGSVLLNKSVELVAEGRGSWLTAGQQESPQHVSPGLQKASEQQVEDLGMQKGAMLLDFAMQQVSVILQSQSVICSNRMICKILSIPLGSKHSQLISLAPRSYALLGMTHAAPVETFR